MKFWILKVHMGFIWAFSFLGDYFSEVLKFWIYRGFRGFRGSFEDLFKHCRIKATFNSEVLKFNCFG